jgi:hypothetical protein
MVFRHHEVEFEFETIGINHLTDDLRIRHMAQYILGPDEASRRVE